MMKWIRHILFWSVCTAFCHSAAWAERAPVLLSPGYQSWRNTLTPTFRWKGVKSEQIEYRLVVVKTNGKRIIDRWVDSDTVYVVSQKDLFRDLEIYYWNVLAYDGAEYYQSQTSSFWIDLNLTLDLEIRNLKILSDKRDWHPGDEVVFEAEITNAGEISCFNTRVVLYNGNADLNYTNDQAFRKSWPSYSSTIPRLDVSRTQKVRLFGKIAEGYNRFYAEIRPDGDYSDKLQFNNITASPAIQTLQDRLKIRGLFVIYRNYSDADGWIQSLADTDMDAIDQNILAARDFIWNHTRVLDIAMDTLRIDRLLNIDDFTYIDKNWGYVLSPWEIQSELNTEQQYDFIFVFYAWANSSDLWSGYRGYTYANQGRGAFAAQPIFPGIALNDEISIHELLRIVDNFYENNGTEQFYAPDERELHTTFANNLSYYQWMLETWPSKNWFKLGKGKKITNTEARLETQQQIIAANLILHQNYPNPFNHSTVIRYELKSPEALVILEIYSLLGERVRTLVDSRQKSGTYTVIWDGMNDAGVMVSSGIYLYRVKVGDHLLMKKLLLIK